MLSLMQMAKTSGALALHAEQNLPFISVLTNPDHRRGDGQLAS